MEKKLGYRMVGIIWFYFKENVIKRYLEECFLNS